MTRALRWLGSLFLPCFLAACTSSTLKSTADALPIGADGPGVAERGGGSTWPMDGRDGMDSSSAASDGGPERAAVYEGGPERVIDVPDDLPESAMDAPYAPVDLGGVGLEAMDAAGGSELVITPNPVTFTAGMCSPDTKTVNVTNNGGSASGSLTASLAGSTMDFAIVGNDCAGALAPQASCTILVVFKPRSRGPKVAVLNVLDSGTAAISVSLSGTVPESTVPVCEVPVLLSISPRELDFGTTSVGVPVGPRVFTVSNPMGCGSTAPLTVLKNDAVGCVGGASQFAVTTTTCSVGLCPDETCEVAVTFTPTLEGSFAADILVTDAVCVPFPGHMVGIARATPLDAGATVAETGRSFE
jgi:hypothetical protein